jgi:fused signal recognition particle receptor
VPDSASALAGKSSVARTKLDGTAIAVREVTSIPVKFVGVGETPEDVRPFDPEAFVEALFAA